MVWKAVIGSARRTLADYMPNIEIPQELYDRFEKRAKEKGYASAESYLQWVLREIAVRLLNASTPTSSHKTYTPEQEATVKDRLRSLGYID